MSATMARPEFGPPAAQALRGRVVVQVWEREAHERQAAHSRQAVAPAAQVLEQPPGLMALKERLEQRVAAAPAKKAMGCFVLERSDPG